MFLFSLYVILICFSLLFLPVISSQLRQNSKFSVTDPPTYPIIGCLISFYKNRYQLLDWYTDLLSKSNTQTITIQRLGARRTIITANPENVEYILKTNFSNYPKGQAFTEILGDFLGCGIFNVDGDKWLTQRKLASHEFTARSLREYVVNILEQEVDAKLVPILECLAEKDDQVVDLQEILRKLAFDIVCKVSLGIDIGSLDSCLAESSLARAFNLASQICAKRAADPVSILWKIKRLIGIGSERELKEAIQEIQAFVSKVIRDKRNASHEDGKFEGEDLLSRMILAGHEERVLRDMVISFIMAGRDTTSAAMTWMFYLLTCHPNVETELVKELKFIQNESLSDHEVLKKMTFLKACLCESMRLYPPVAWDSKHAIASELLPDGTKVHAGDRVTYFPYGMGRMKSLWGENRLEFKPERWLERGVIKEECPYKFPVFQAGPRVCLGKEMAFTQMKYVVASILRQFEFRPVYLDKPVFVPQLTAHMAGGFKVHVHRRHKAM